MFKQITVVGLGYIGLPTAVAFALNGLSVYGVEIEQHKLALIEQGKSPITEPQLEEALQQAVACGLLRVGSHMQPSDVFIITVPTPFDTQKQQPDLSYVQAAVAAIAPVLKRGDLVVLESTSPVGTTEQVAQWLAKLRPDLRFPSCHPQADIYLAYCPERVLPGKIMYEIIHNDRVIGGLSPQSAQQAVDLYQIFAKGECVATDARTAEMCKLVENSFRDVNIAFANELSMLCDVLNIDVWKLIELANRHPRVNILQPGAGVGGHCIAVDPWFIITQQPEHTALMRAAREVNETKPNWVVEKVKAAFADCVVDQNRSPSSIKIACLGLAFKADVADLRQSPALQITQQLATWHQGELLVVEPYIRSLPSSLPETVRLISLEAALREADIMVLLVDHSIFKTVQPEQLPQYWVDTKGIWR